MRKKKIKTFLDSGVLIAAFRADSDLGGKALALLDDASRTFVTSEFVKLELLPKATYRKRAEEVSFYKVFFATAKLQPLSKKLLETALFEATRWDLSATDALHVEAAKLKGCEELCTTEGEGKPLFRVKGLRVVSAA